MLYLIDELTQAQALQALTVKHSNIKGSLFEGNSNMDCWLDDHSMTEIKRALKLLGVKGYSKMNRSDLVDLAIDTALELGTCTQALHRLLTELKSFGGLMINTEAEQALVDEVPTVDADEEIEETLSVPDYVVSARRIIDRDVHTTCEEVLKFFDLNGLCIEWENLFDTIEEDGEKYEIDKEILNYWIVSDWLWEKLNKHGEVTGKALDLHIWGQTQSDMESVIERVRFAEYAR